MNRREFISFLSSAAVSPLVAHAQQPALPVIGFLVTATAEGYADQVAAVRAGMAEVGIVEGRNVTIDYRYAEDRYDRLPALARDLVQRGVKVIFATGGIISPLAAKHATTNIPIVFTVGSDPVQHGLVASLGHPGGNVTGMSLYNSQLVSKRVGLLRELLPNAAVFAELVNPNNLNVEANDDQFIAAVQNFGMRSIIVKASTGDELDSAFAAMFQHQVSGLIINNDPFFQGQALSRIIALLDRYRLPAIFGGFRKYVATGALMSYGTDTLDMYRQAGVYVGRILKGEKPYELPVVQPTKFKFVINLKTAKVQGLQIPDKLLALADEVIE